MVQYDRMVLNHLLDTYENSLLSIGENRRKVQIEFRFTEHLYRHIMMRVHQNMKKFIF